MDLASIMMEHRVCQHNLREPHCVCGSPWPCRSVEVGDTVALSAERSWTSASGEILTEADAARLAEQFERDDAALDEAIAVVFVPVGDDGDEYSW